ncbi:oleuropein beta-glucosidase-like [Henckelia pumila]|uniref:oleuropein beta-glucosidase-like n=1 Tax=Henckelia pumila TaxID=405737 RepID=UPI003C6DE202
MADEQTNALAFISSGDGSLATLGRPAASENKSVRYSASKISSVDFPRGFVFGAATAAYQVEGAYAEGGKSLSIWDAFALRTPSKIKDGSNGCVATDQYHRYKEDVMLVKKLGFGAYRFSIAWTRVLPGGRLSMGKNMVGIKYYNDVIDFCLAQGIEPYVTIFHFDLPQCLEDEYGGFLSKQIVKDFVEFAELCFWEFGDRVKHWFTINEPWSYVYQGYVLGNFPPGHGGANSTISMAKYNDASTEPYKVAHHLILAHAYVVDVYRRNFKTVQGGKIGMVNFVMWYEPLDEYDSEDQKASLRAIDFMMGWFVEPTVTGQYPESMREFVGERLPTFTKDEENLVKGSFDFQGLNYYTTNYAKNNPTPDATSPAVADIHVTYSTERDGILIGPAATGSNWILRVPWGLQKILQYAKNKYGNPVIYITENGVSEANNKSLSVTEALVDESRNTYIQDHLYYIKKAIDDDQVKVKAYFVWSLLDNYEWFSGYTSRFGLFYVDFANGLTRYPKNSAVWMLNFLHKRMIGLKKRSHDDEEAEDNGLPKRVKS